MQSATSDVNAAVMAWRQMLTNAVNFKSKVNVGIAINNLNSILPDDLSLIFDTVSYNDSQKAIHHITCQKCNTDNPVDTTKIITDFSIGSGHHWNNYLSNYNMNRISKAIKCTNKKCGHLIDLEFNPLRVSMESKQDDRICPELPKTNNIIEAIFNDAKFWEWVSLVSGKLENQFREFRNQKAGAAGDLDLGLEL